MAFLFKTSTLIIRTEIFVVRARLSSQQFTLQSALGERLEAVVGSLMGERKVSTAGKAASVLTYNEPVS